jgi:hypothetical protein
MAETINILGKEYSVPGIITSQEIISILNQERFKAGLPAVKHS